MSQHTKRRQMLRLVDDGEAVLVRVSAWHKALVRLDCVAAVIESPDGIAIELVGGRTLYVDTTLERWRSVTRTARTACRGGRS